MSLLASVPQISTSGRGDVSSKSAIASASDAPARLVVGAVEPDFGLRGRERDERPAAQPLQARRPFGLQQAALERARRQVRLDRAQRRHRRRGVADLMAAGAGAAAAGRGARRASS